MSAEHHQDRNEEPAQKWFSISSVSRIIRASFHQGDEEKFPMYTGVQCAAMALSSVVKMHLHSPDKWDTNDVNNILEEGQILYSDIRERSKSQNVIIPSDGYLYIKNFDVIKDQFTMFEKSFSITYDDNPSIFGSLNNQQRMDFGDNLLNGLQNLFRQHDAGILIANSKCFAVMKCKDKYYIFDSHSCGPKGDPTEEGQACVIECDTLKELSKLIKRAAEDLNSQYTIDFIEVVLKNGLNSKNVEEAVSANLENVNQPGAADAEEIEILSAKDKCIDIAQEVLKISSQSFGIAAEPASNSENFKKFIETLSEYSNIQKREAFAIGHRVLALKLSLIIKRTKKSAQREKLCRLRNQSLMLDLIKRRVIPVSLKKCRILKSKSQLKLPSDVPAPNTNGIEQQPGSKICHDLSENVEVNNQRIDVLEKFEIPENAKLIVSN